jgi:hypothetical protein
MTKTLTEVDARVLSNRELVIREWIRRLRAGEDKQIKGRFFNRGGVCAVGLLHKIVEGDKPVVDPLKLVDKLDIPLHVMEQVMSMNDGGFKFPKIALYLEHCLLK